MRIVLATGERLAGGAVRSLEKSGHEVVGVISPYQGVYRRAGLNRHLVLFDLLGWDILKTCKRRDIPLRITKRLEDGDIRAFLRQIRAEMLVVFGWPRLISSKVLECFPAGACNIHPSLLPRLRGADPLFAIIDEASDGFGISYHRLAPEMDAGNLYHTVSLRYDPNAAYDAHYARLLRAIHQSLPTAVRAMVAHPEGSPQSGEPTHAKRFRQHMRTLEPSAAFEVSRRRTLACQSHHSRLTACNGRVLEFHGMRRITPSTKALEELSVPPIDGTVLEVGWTRIRAMLGGEWTELSGVRVFGHPFWMSPLILRQHIRPGDHLADRKTVLAMWRGVRD
ncbi:Formyl-trans-N domain-containing protein [Sulfidibacter corallicola]|uniref:Formyl transferase N-terminal domain-containing protein n=1 Tax=Sulfidibacter corallicola TaxID=2818388 RepID=A0A8A4TS15_SULCO|nr:formyltransferase family protein [Sulfidibacter corallicola]QTD52756.1 hypothetical protein J3U87_09790 [Sulfidibacter corallicola]